MSGDITLDCLREFIHKFGASLDPRVWANLIREEADELEDELEADPIDKAKALKEVSDLMYVTVGFNMTASGPEQLGLFPKDEHGEMMDLLSYSAQLHGEAIEILGDLNYLEAFRRVHNSNMSKLGSDGKPVLRDDGKVLKGPDYKAPKLDDLCTQKVIIQ